MDIKSDLVVEPIFQLRFNQSNSKKESYSIFLNLFLLLQSGHEAFILTDPSE